MHNKKILLSFLFLLLALILIVAWQWPRVQRLSQGGEFDLRNIPSQNGSRPVIEDQYGYHPAIWGVFPDGPDGDKVFDLAAEVGAPYVVLGLNRKWVQKENGTYDWTPFEKIVQRADDRGLKLIPKLLLGNNFWAATKIPSGQKQETVTSAAPSDLTTTWDADHGYSKNLTEYLQALFKKFPGKFPWVSIGNEPNAEKYWAGTYEEYIRVLQTAAAAIHQTDPTVKVIDGGFASEAWGCVAYDQFHSGQWTEQQAVDFLRGYYQFARQYQKIAKANNAEIIDFLKNNSEISQECESRDAYFRGLVGHVDAVNFHFYENLDYLDELLDYLDAKMTSVGWKNPVIVTNEFGSKHFNDPSFDVAGDDQAKELRAKMEYATSRGLPLITWFSVNGPDTKTGGFLSTHAPDGTPYEAAHEYRRFLEEQATK